MFLLYHCNILYAYLNRHGVWSSSKIQCFRYNFNSVFAGWEANWSAYAVLHARISYDNKHLGRGMKDHVEALWDGLIVWIGLFRIEHDRNMQSKCWASSGPRWAQEPLARYPAYVVNKVAEQPPWSWPIVFTMSNVESIWLCYSQTTCRSRANTPSSTSSSTTTRPSQFATSALFGLTDISFTRRRSCIPSKNTGASIFLSNLLS